jgi:hypothetical protein
MLKYEYMPSDFDPIFPILGDQADDCRRRSGYSRVRPRRLHWPSKCGRSARKHH